MEASTLPSTRNVPAKFLKSAYLVGRIPQRALSTDKRVCYGLYIPPDAYISISEDTPSRAKQSTQRKLPLLVSIHGTRRDLTGIYRDLVPLADGMPCAILEPLFPAGMDSPYDLDSYKILRSATLRSDRALLDILDEVAHIWPGVETNKVFMIGFSGGGQFVHRFLYLYPERLAGVSVGAPGSATMLDPEQKWPRGTADVETLFGVQIQKHLIQEVPIQLVIGDLDRDEIRGKEFWSWLRQVDKSQVVRGSRASDNDAEVSTKQIAKSRWVTAHELMLSWKQDGFRAYLEVVPGVGHSSEGVRAAVLAYLAPFIREQWDRSDVSSTDVQV